MSRQYLCDLCRRDVALENQLIPIKFGEEMVAEVCFNCASTLKKGLREQVAAIKESPMEQAPPAADAPTEPKKPAVQVQPNHEPTEPVQATA